MVIGLNVTLVSSVAKYAQYALLVRPSVSLALRSPPIIRRI
jgi:hypothetical protein